MADRHQQINVTKGAKGEDDLPLPPPPLPRSPQESLPGPEEQSHAFLPMVPPKETFSTFYQQRQKSELKRLFKHIHPELRKNLDNVVDDELVEVLNSETKQADTGYQGEVQSMRWIFENWSLDNIGDPHMTKKLLEEEAPQRGDVRGTSSIFERVELDGAQHSSTLSRCGSVKGDVHTATWLFETQSLDTLSKTYPEEGELVEAVLKEPMQQGDVKGTRQLFESKPLDALGRCTSVEDQSFFKLKSEIQEQKGDVKKTVKLFQAEPCCAIRDSTGNVHEIKSICREEIQSNNVKTARWLFETQPLDVINKDASKVQVIRGISLEEAQKGGVDKKRWMFETQHLSAIHESIQEDKFQGTIGVVEAADVGNKRQMFETQPLAALKGESATGGLPKEEIVGGDVQSTLWLFETQPIDTLKDSYEVGRLKKVTVTNEEKGSVQIRKSTFETSTLDSISKEMTERGIKCNAEEIERGDVKSYKHLFETIPIGDISQAENLQTEKQGEIIAGNVKGNTTLFETTPLYAIKDCLGNFHEVTTVSREQSIKGNVQNYRWMFETRPMDQFGDKKAKVEIIKGITRQEDQAGDVKMAKWLFETQPSYSINQTEQLSSVQQEVTHKGDVKNCKWLFETQPMDILYEKSEKKPEEEAMPKINVKSHTWLFETQPLDAIKDGVDLQLKLCSTFQDDATDKVDVKLVKHLFETETLDSMGRRADTDQDVRYVSKIHIQSGDVSRVKEIFQSKSVNEKATALARESETEDQNINIQTGCVRRSTWLFENNAIDTIKDEDSNKNISTVSDVQGGDVGNKKLIFETHSLDKIHDKDRSPEHQSVFVEKPATSVDVKSSTMLFESKPLYAIRDKEGLIHEVTTVKKEEVLSGDVRGVQWQFETKPLDIIKPQEEVFVIRAVTQEDVVKGDVKSARWKFETQPLDSFTSQEEGSMRTIVDIEKGDVQQSKQHFESQGASGQKFVRMVSVRDVQEGNVRTSTWLFENQPIDTLKGELQEQSALKTVHRLDSHKGDVKRCTWLFETQPLDTIKQVDPSASSLTHETIPQADVKSTTWMFESTPLDRIGFQRREDSENSVKETLDHLHYFKVIHTQGIVIEANENHGKSVKMAKYQFINNQGPNILKEETVEGNIKNIILQLLLRTNLTHQIVLVKEDEHGHVETTRMQIPTTEAESTEYSDQGQNMANVAQVITGLLSYDKTRKEGIVMQETESGYAAMTVYSLSSHYENLTDSHEITKGNVRLTIGSLLSTSKDHKAQASFQFEENERGNVNLYKKCIEKGDLEYLKSLQTEPSENDSPLKEPVEIIHGDIKEAKRNLNQQKEKVERTVLDIVPGDVKNVKKVFSEGSTEQGHTQKEEVIRGDVFLAKHSLGQAANQPIVLEKEEIVSGDIKAAKESLEQAKKQSMRVEREIIIPGKIYDLDVSSQEASDTTGSLTTVSKEEIISGNVKAAKQSLEQAKRQGMREGGEVVIPGKIYDLNVSTSEDPSQQIPNNSTNQQTVTQGTASTQGQIHQNFTTTQKSTSVQQARSLHTSVQVSGKTETSSVSTVKEMRSQQMTSSHQKVSVSEEEQGSDEKHKTTRGRDVRVTVGDADPARPIVNPFVSSEDGDRETNEAAVVRGDIKAALKSLQSPAAAQPVEKEEVVRGDVQAALRSLEKCSINVSKGDFRAAMIYRNAGQTYSEGRKKQRAESEKSAGEQPASAPVLPSDAALSPSVSVTYEERPVAGTLKPAPVAEPSPDASSDRTNASSAFTGQSQNPPPLPPKVCDKPATIKPVIPPKPPCLNTAPRQNFRSRPVSAKLSPPPLPPKPLICQENEQKNYAHNKDCHSEGTTTKTVQGHSLNFDYTKEHQAVDKEITSCPGEIKQTKEIHPTNEVEEKVTKTISKKTAIISSDDEKEGDKQGPQKINAAEEIRACMQSYSEDGEARNEMNQSFQAALQNFGGRKNCNAPIFHRKIKVTRDEVRDEREKESSSKLTQGCSKDVGQQGGEAGPQGPHASVTHSPAMDSCCNHEECHEEGETKVVMREKKAKRETEDERRQRLSVHKEEIMRGNVKAAMEIFENLRKREELKIILSKVAEIEGETSEVDVRSMKNLFENVPAWIVAPGENITRGKSTGETKGRRTESTKDDTDGVSSVEVAFGDLERASAEIIHLKEQTLTKLIDIEEAIKKALYSVSNLKSESDIAGLSGLFKESLGTVHSSPTANNIRKISIVSSKAKRERGKEPERDPKPESKKAGKSVETQRPAQDVAKMRPCTASQSSPSFISIQSAARKPAEAPKAPTASHQQNGPARCRPDAYQSKANGSASKASFYSPLNSRRNVSVLELQTVPEPADIIGTKTVSEKYEKTDCFGNKFVSSKTSTIVTKQAETKTLSAYEAVAAPARYDVLTSPPAQRSAKMFSENPQPKVNESGRVFVTFGHPRPAKP
ncbi:xin actin-binding repeat-containing protein 1 isoform X2 [Brienomyrus brachyistius]|nr:xin actin-binding repeat-containing protein 1 isoform X2 [Brienomyrus brachyistius]XP_048867064.1 xin actin-binding repeat-containing protein 1 isoform X2 [Brienomyrus brachyistius]